MVRRAGRSGVLKATPAKTNLKGWDGRMAEWEGYLECIGNVNIKHMSQAYYLHSRFLRIAEILVHRKCN